MKEDYEKYMRKAGMTDTAKALRVMAVSFGESTETLSEGLYGILSAGVAPAQAMDVLSASVKAAKAGMTDTAKAADAITTILNSYGLSADNAADISDKLFAIVKRGKTTFAELASNIGKVASMASSAGISFDELGAAIATMTRAGLQTENAITAMKAIITGFLKPTDEAKKTAKSFGLELSSATLKAEGLVGVLRKLGGASAEQLTALFPDMRALGRAGLAAALKQAEGQAWDLELMLHSTGLTQEAFGKMTNTLIFNLQRLKQSFVILGVTVGNILAPVFKQTTE